MPDGELLAAPRRLLELFVSGDQEKLTEHYLGILEHFSATQYRTLSGETRAGIAAFLKGFFAVLCEPSHVIPDHCVIRLLQMNPLVSALAALTPFRTTDLSLRMVLTQPNNFVKVLILANARTTTAVPLEPLFSANARLASIWYAIYFFGGYGQADTAVRENVRRHIREVSPNLEYVGGASLEAMFAPSYFDEVNDRKVKETLNRSVQVQLATVEIENKPDPRHIAVITQRWFSTSAVYKILRHFVAALKPHYRLTLVHLGDGPRNAVEAKDFDAVRFVTMSGQGRIDLREISSNDFGMAFFPDVGMSEESVLLSNLRLCPVQFASYGHSVSTWGSRIDYWIGGRDAEPDVAPENNYSERLLLIPGSGGPPVVPAYTRRRPERSSAPVIVNCPCGAYKLNCDVLDDLVAIKQEAAARGFAVLIRFFPGVGVLRLNNFLLLTGDLSRRFGAAEFEVVAELPYPEYMAAMESGHVTLDTYPFGGCNSIMDSLWVHRALVTRYGNEWNNRYGLALLRRFGLAEMAVPDREEYRRLAVRLICDRAYRDSVEQKIGEIDLEFLRWDPAEAEAFRQAVDFLASNHDSLRIDGSRAPISVG